MNSIKRIVICGLLPALMLVAPAVSQAANATAKSGATTRAGASAKAHTSTRAHKIQIPRFRLPPGIWNAPKNGEFPPLLPGNDGGFDGGTNDLPEDVIEGEPGDEIGNTVCKLLHLPGCEGQIVWVPKPGTYGTLDRGDQPADQAQPPDNGGGDQAAAQSSDDGGGQQADQPVSEEEAATWVAPPADPGDMYAWGDAY